MVSIYIAQHPSDIPQRQIQPGQQKERAKTERIAPGQDSWEWSWDAMLVVRRHNS
jgi:hypothetical protein